MRLTADLIEQLLRKSVDVGGISEQPLLVLPIDSPLVLGVQLQNELLAVAAANRPQQVKAQHQIVQSLSIIAGPTPGGIANTSTIYIGGPAVSVNDGFPLPPSAIINLGFMDLYSLWFAGATPGDCLRLIYIA